MGELVIDLLETTGLIPEAKFEVLREKAKELPVVQVLIDEGLASSEAIARIVAAQHGLPVIELGSVGIDPIAASSVPLHVLEQVNAVAYAFEGDSLCVAIADPQNIHGIDSLRLASRHPIVLRVAASEDIANELGRLARTAEAFGTRSGMSEIAELEVIDEEELDDLEVDDGISDAPLVRLVNSIIFEAAEDGASDVHFEPQADALVVRFRIDGVLHETQRIPRRSAIGVTTRLKVLAKLDIAERRKPQDGRISLSASAAGRMLDVRVATLPTVEGESVVMRLLDKSKKPPTMEEVGLGTAMQERLGGLIHRPTGALLVTGPTGSGKSTTLFAAMTEINRPEINVITVEDPVEYRLAGLNQVQINPRAGLTFATALRSILRSDPDVVMVGEIRDVETAKISIEAALTGHFVLSTLHTNDAPSALTRLNEMGVEPFLTGAAVTGVLAQRLARRLCEHCKELYVPSKEELFTARIPEELRHGKMELFRRNGCVRCRQTGYSGRIGVFQLLAMNEELSALTGRADGDRLVKVVGALCGVHAQVQASAELQLAARVEGIVRADVRKALWEERALVKAWTVRGTLHLHPADELALWHAARRAVLGPADTELPEWRDPAGVLHPALGADEVAAVRAAVREALDGRCLLRDELAEEVVSRVGAAPRDRLRSGFAFFLGELCQGPPQGSRITLARPDQWIDAWQEVTDEREALQEVCRRFLRTYGPARPADFSEWFGTAAFRVAEARALFDELAGELDEVAVEGRGSFVLAGDLSFPAPSRQVRLLPEYDVYVMGFRERDQLVPQPVRELIASHGRGRYEGPAGVRLVLVDGVAAGLWERRKRGKRLELEVRLARRLGKARLTELEREADRVGAFLGLEPVLSVDSS